MRRRTVLVASLTTSFLPAVLSATARAHGVGGSRFDAPVPLSFLFAGAAATVALTALLLGLTSDPVRHERGVSNPIGASASETNTPGTSTSGANAPTATDGRARPATAGTGIGPRNAGRVVATLSPAMARGVRFGARLAFLVCFVAAVGAGLFGTQADAESLATAFVWPVWIKGVGLYAIAFGSPWAVLAPWRTLYDALRQLEGAEVALFEYPERLGRWPALAGFVVLVGVLENLTIVPRSPRMTAAVVAGYGALMLGGSVLFGRAWLREADAFAVLYGLLGRVAPIRPVRTDPGGYRLALRAPWRGCTRPVADVAVVAVTVAAVYTVSFDGFTSTIEFQRLLSGARNALGAGGVASVSLYFAGLLGFVCAFVVVARAMESVASTQVPGGWRTIALAFAPTVLPIAAAYELAHNYPFVLSNLGLFVAQVGTAITRTAIDPIAQLEWLSVGAFWYSQVLLIVCGHVIAVVAAHRVALAAGETARNARRLHAPLVALMIGYTVLSLWIVSRPVVAG